MIFLKFKYTLYNVYIQISKNAPHFRKERSIFITFVNFNIDIQLVKGFKGMAELKTRSVKDYRNWYHLSHHVERERGWGDEGVLEEVRGEGGYGLKVRPFVSKVGQK